jgi:hypothetical protein
VSGAIIWTVLVLRLECSTSLSPITVVAFLRHTPTQPSTTCTHIYTRTHSHSQVYKSILSVGGAAVRSQVIGDTSEIHSALHQHAQSVKGSAAGAGADAGAGAGADTDARNGPSGVMSPRTPDSSDSPADSERRPPCVTEGSKQCGDGESVSRDGGSGGSDGGTESLSDAASAKLVSETEIVSQAAVPPTWQQTLATSQRRIRTLRALLVFNLALIGHCTEQSLYNRHTHGVAKAFVSLLLDKVGTSRWHSSHSHSQSRHLRSFLRPY